MSRYLTHARLLRDRNLDRIDPLFVPSQEAARIRAADILIGALMWDEGKSKNDYLWREELPGEFYILSSRPPTGMPVIFDFDVRPFAPVLAAGDRIGFQLRANPSIARTDNTDNIGKSPGRIDVIMNALHALSPSDRTTNRAAVVQTSGAAWLQRHGLRSGFTPLLESLQVGRYRHIQHPRSGDINNNISVVEFSGKLMVTEPEVFLSALMTGIGGRRSIGCGLLLLT